MSTTKIEKCPYCGEKKPTVFVGVTHKPHYIICEGCEAFGPESVSESEAIEAWNRVANRSVKVPEEKGIAEDEEDDNMAHYAQGWNACLSEIKYLNPHLKFEK